MKVVKLSKYAMVMSMFLAFVIAAGLAVLINEKENIAGTYAGDDDPDQTLNLSKTVDENMVFAGTTVNYTYEITNNTRAYTINNIQLVDNELGTISCPSDTLTPGGSMTCTDSAVINQATTNIATVSGILSDEPGTQVSDTETETVNVLPNIEVDKTVTPNNLTEDGTVSYTITVTNPSNDNAPYTFEFTSLEDVPYGDLLDLYCPLDEVSTILDPGESFVCTFDANLTCDDQPSLTNTVTATGNAIYNLGGDQLPITTVMTGSDDATVDIACEEGEDMTVVKTANPTSLTEDGNVEYTVSVTNNLQNYNITLTSMNDSIYGNLSGKGDCDDPMISPGVSILPGSTYTCSFEEEVTCDEGPSITDVVTVTASYTDEDGVSHQLSDSDDATVDIACEEEEEPGLATIHGMVYNDANQNETLDVGEIGLNDVAIELLNNSNTTLNTNQTNSNGEFSFSDLDPGVYALRETDPAGYLSSTSNDITNIVVATDDSSYHLFGDYLEGEEETIPISTLTTTPTPTTSSALPTTGPGDSPYPLFAALALLPLMAAGYAFYSYKRK